MKTRIPFLALAVVCLTAQNLRADPDPAPPAPTKAKRVKAVPAIPAPPTEPFEAAVPAPPPAPADAPLGQAPENDPIIREFIDRDVVEPRFENRLARVMGMADQSKRSGMAGRTLVIPGTEVDKDQLREHEEDLNVMARVLEKAISSKSSDDEFRKEAMGIELLSFGGVSSGVRNLYLEGHGALFLLRVNFPLLAPPKAEDAEDAPVKDPPNTAWEEARSDLYGGRRGGAPFRIPRGEAYDEQKIERLKDSLFEALKNAAHIRHLKPAETITVMVAGESGRVERSKRVTVGGGGFGGGRGGGGEPFNADVVKWVETGRPSPARGDSTLLLRVKKSDADALTAGQLNPEEFRKKATLLVY